MRELIVPIGTTPTTLLSYLKKNFPIGFVRKVIRKDGVRINGIRGKEDMPVKAGDTLTFYVQFNPHKKTEIPQSAQQFEILLENDDFVVINKKAGIAVHEGKSVTFQQSVIGRLEAYYKAEGVMPYLVHRLDRDTSGCLLVVKKEELVEEFEKLFEEGDVNKEYLTLVKGKLKTNKGKIDLELPGRDKNPVPALTLYEVQKYFSGGDVSLVDVKIKTGRMHQIRLHFEKIEHPVVLDDEHGDFAFNKEFRRTYGLRRQFLHAQQLGFTFGGQKFSIEAPLPKDLLETLESLEELS